MNKQVRAVVTGTAGLAEQAGLIQLRVGIWQDLGYEDPPTPECKAIPPLGERSASAIRAGHEAIGDIDQLIRELHKVRSQLVSQLRQDEDIRMARPVPRLLGGWAALRQDKDVTRPVPAADPADPPTRLLRAIYGHCPDHDECTPEDHPEEAGL